MEGNRLLKTEIEAIETDKVDLEQFVSVMKCHVFDNTDHITEQFLLFAGAPQDKDPNEVFIT